MLGIFNNYWALPYGPVESEIYDAMSDLSNFQISNNSISLKENATLDFTSISQNGNADAIDTSIDQLRLENESLVRMAAFDLVELSHKSEAWKIVFSNAQKNGFSSKAMPVNLLRDTIVFYN